MHSSIAMLSIASVLATLFHNFDLTLHETDDDTMAWRDQTLMVNKKNMKTFIKPRGPSKSLYDFQNLASRLEKGLSDTTIPPAIPEPDSVILPDLFVLWAATPVKLNPHYWTVSPQAEEWFRMYGFLNLVHLLFRDFC